VDATANDGEIPLHLAASEGYTRVLRQLVEARAAVNCTNEDGETPLHVAVQHVGGKTSLNHIRTLLELGADKSTKDANGHTVFEAAGLHTNRADEVRDVLAGVEAATLDPDDHWPDAAHELEDGTDPVDVAEALRELGNTRFKESKYEDAAKIYRKAKAFLPTGAAQFEPIAEGDAQGVRARQCAIAVSSNAAMCKLKLGQHDACVEICDAILRMDVKNVKAMYRKALGLRALGEVADAENCLRDALEIEPKDSAILREISDIARERKKEQEQEKRLARKMFG